MYFLYLYHIHHYVYVRDEMREVIDQRLIITFTILLSPE